MDRVLAAAVLGLFVVLASINLRDSAVRFCEPGGLRCGKDHEPSTTIAVQWAEYRDGLWRAKRADGAIIGISTPCVYLEGGIVP